MRNLESPVLLDAKEANADATDEAQTGSFVERKVLSHDPAKTSPAPVESRIVRSGKAGTKYVPLSSEPSQDPRSPIVTMA